MLHSQAFNAFTAGLRQEHAQEVTQWEHMVKAWEVDHSMANPYMLPEESVTVNDIRKELAEEEHRIAEQGGTVGGDTSPSGFIISGLGIEDTQLLLQTDAQRRNQTAAQMASIQERRTHLLRRIQRFQSVQTTYMPGLPAYLAEHPSSPPNLSQPETIPIHLPSSIATHARSSVCPNLAAVEDRLRYAHAHEALEDLRRQLRTRSLAARFKSENVRSQGPHTRMRGLQDQIEVKVRAARDRYNIARDALLRLWGSGNWENTLRLLGADDVRGMNERSLTQEEQEADARAQELAGLGPGEADRLPDVAMTGIVERGEGRHGLSWIWYNVSAAEVAGDTSGSMHECIRVEWVKARARAQRWTEEVILVDEEMRRVLEFGRWRATWWEEQAQRRGSEGVLLEGVQAYAYKQADAERRLVSIWESRWAPVRARARATVARLHASHALSEESMNVFEELEVEVDLGLDNTLDDEGLDDDH
ncbi:hypothetical protein Hypma_008439 [Hypsizygus marmoreus]|uniref:Uncharacterized protein n=1 Tax=Hypsizygus marmoreus TaxID=39966 RepID=A0A369JVA8_HYPMA|nr:hypothetical protein Hypma_008439 [Hypsizygus marmoreus]